MATEHLDQVLERIRTRERSARRTALIWTLVPVVAAFVLLGYAAWRVDSAISEAQRQQALAERYAGEAAEYAAESERLEARVATLDEALRTTREELEAAREKLEATVDMSRYRHELTPVESKEIASLYPRAAEALRLMLRLREQGVGWHLGGQQPEEGFDSPSFAAWVLREEGVLEGMTPIPGESLLATSRRLYERLEPVSEPGIGDLVFYPAGYVLFYFEDAGGEAFVAGMTPFGIVALEPDFAEPVGFRRSGLAP